MRASTRANKAEATGWYVGMGVKEPEAAGECTGTGADETKVTGECAGTGANEMTVVGRPQAGACVGTVAGGVQAWVDIYKWGTTGAPGEEESRTRAFKNQQSRVFVGRLRSY